VFEMKPAFDANIAPHIECVICIQKLNAIKTIRGIIYP
jgi:hypothetical protein